MYTITTEWWVVTAKVNTLEDAIEALKDWWLIQLSYEQLQSIIQHYRFE